MSKEPVRVTEEVAVDEILNFKFSLKKAREFAGLIQNGKEMPPVHLQTLPSGYYRVCDGRHRVAAAFMLGKSEIMGRYSTREEVEDGPTTSEGG